MVPSLSGIIPTVLLLHMPLRYVYHLVKFGFAWPSIAFPLSLDAYSIPHPASRLSNRMTRTFRTQHPPSPHYLYASSPVAPALPCSTVLICTWPETPLMFMTPAVVVSVVVSSAYIYHMPWLISGFGIRIPD